LEEKGEGMNDPRVSFKYFSRTLKRRKKRPKKRHGNREVFVEENVPYGNKDYLLVF